MRELQNKKLPGAIAIDDFSGDENRAGLDGCLPFIAAQQLMLSSSA
jgi:hypothetical protein